ncbi:MAG: TIM barrel protein [bacterium]
MPLLFGTSGPPRSSPERSTEAGVRRVRELGLGCMEVEFVQGVRMSGETAGRVRAAADETGVRLTCHAPYYVNLASKEERKIRDSIKRIFESARVGALCGADGVVFHPGFYMGKDAGEVYTMIRRGMESVIEKMREAKMSGVWLRPELTGKPSQFGDVDELLRLSRDLEMVLPTIDFSHLYARTAGECNSYGSFAAVLEKTGSELGDAALRNMHIHLSGIEYGPKGERRHLPVEGAGFRYRDVIRALVDFEVEGRVVTESPCLEDDALLFQNCWLELAGKR